MRITSTLPAGKHGVRGCTYARLSFCPLSYLSLIAASTYTVTHLDLCVSAIHTPLSDQQRPPLSRPSILESCSSSRPCSVPAMGPSRRSVPRPPARSTRACTACSIAVSALTTVGQRISPTTASTLTSRSAWTSEYTPQDCLHEHLGHRKSSPSTSCFPSIDYYHVPESCPTDSAIAPRMV